MTAEATPTYPGIPCQPAEPIIPISGIPCQPAEPIIPISGLEDVLQALGVALFHTGAATSQYHLIVEFPDDPQRSDRLEWAEQDAAIAHRVLHHVHEGGIAHQHHLGLGPEFRKYARQAKVWLSQERARAHRALGLEPAPEVTDDLHPPEQQETGEERRTPLRPQAGERIGFVDRPPSAAPGAALRALSRGVSRRDINGPAPSPCTTGDENTRMSRTINKVIIMGRLGVDPELRYTVNGTPVLNVRVVTDNFRNGVQEEPDWHNIVFWGRDAELVAQHSLKGSRILLMGRIKQSAWKAEDGTTRNKTEIHASEGKFDRLPPALRPGAGSAAGGSNRPSLLGAQEWSVSSSYFPRTGT